MLLAAIGASTAALAALTVSVWCFMQVRFLPEIRLQLADHEATSSSYRLEMKKLVSHAEDLLDNADRKQRSASAQLSRVNAAKKPDDSESPQLSDVEAARLRLLRGGR